MLGIGRRAPGVSRCGVCMKVVSVAGRFLRSVPLTIKVIMVFQYDL